MNPLFRLVGRLSDKKNLSNPFFISKNLILSWDKFFSLWLIYSRAAYLIIPNGLTSSSDGGVCNEMVNFSEEEEVSRFFKGMLDIEIVIEIAFPHTTFSLY